MMKQDTQDVLITFVWTAAAAWLLFDGIADVIYPMNQLIFLDVGEIIVGVVLFILLALWLMKLKRR